MSDKLLVDAMLAQVEGGGGCTRIDEITDTTSPFFPSVQFFTGRCLNEHAQELRSTVALDEAGLVYSIRTEEGLRFLTRRHPPVGLSNETIGTFAMWATGVLDEFAEECEVGAVQDQAVPGADGEAELWSEFEDALVRLRVACDDDVQVREVHITRSGLVDVL